MRANDPSSETCNSFSSQRDSPDRKCRHDATMTSSMEGLLDVADKHAYVVAADGPEMNFL